MCKILLSNRWAIRTINICTNSSLTLSRVVLTVTHNFRLFKKMANSLHVLRKFSNKRKIILWILSMIATVTRLQKFQSTLKYWIPWKNRGLCRSTKLTTKIRCTLNMEVIRPWNIRILWNPVRYLGTWRKRMATMRIHLQEVQKLS